MSTLEAGLARLLVAVLRGLGPVAASNLGGRVARMIGPWLPVSRVAETNLVLTMPELDRAARRRIVRGVWDNLGRTVGELPNLARLAEAPAGELGWTVEGVEGLDAVASARRPAILFSAHLSNWELMPVAAARHGLDLGTFYRAADNAAVDGLIGDLRREAARRPIQFFAKGSSGARQALQHLKGGGFLGMLVDQKMNDGIKARLFGRQAMTPAAGASLALRLRCPMIPVHVVRLGPARFRVVCEDALPFPDTGDRAADLQALTQSMNDRVESWVRAHPESWLWLHRRFEKSLYRRIKS